MLSANVSAFSMRKAVGGGAAPTPYVLQILVVAGGGTGANYFYCSGGGAPGEQLTSTVTEPAAGLSYSVIVGAGASSVSSTSEYGALGNESQLYRSAPSGLSMVAKRGSGGATSFPVASSSSITGGGGSGQSGSGSSGSTHVNGYVGGDGSNNYPHYSGGGGAGYGGDGVDAVFGYNGAGAGGAGSSWLDGTLRGGGGGGCYTSRLYDSLPTAASGGSGGGGSGCTVNRNGANSGTNAAANTGSGGGGGGREGFQVGLGGNGGSGVVIIRYEGETRGTGGTITSSGGYTYHTFNSSGTFTTA